MTRGSLVLWCAAASAVLTLPVRASTLAAPQGAEWVAEHYDKREVMIPMRDGVRLSTAIYAPKGRDAEVPILLRRTPYGRKPYGDGVYPEKLGPSELFAEKGYVFVVQDVRGCYLSEGEFENMRPHDPQKDSPQEIDESSDAWDTIDWLIANVEGHNGRVGMYGISYPGFYAAAGMIDAHPALRAVSPQAPIADWWYDDFHHHGAFFLPHFFNFFSRFGLPRPEPVTERSWDFDHGTPDGYRFFLELGPLSNVDAWYFDGKIAFWNDFQAHPNRDEFWQARDLLPHLSNTAPAVMTVGGWYDAEDLYGPLNIYRSVEAKNPDVTNVLVMGPWRHGGWSRDDGDRLGKARFGSKTSLFYRERLELPFFEHFLRDVGTFDQAEATVFDTGAGRWRHFGEWPPGGARPTRLFLHEDGYLSVNLVGGGESEFTEFVSDPAKPVPFTEEVAIGMTREYMTDDQRFASRRPDVLTFRSSKFHVDTTVAGPLVAVLHVSTSGQDADWVVKLIDEFPPDAADPEDAPEGWHAGGYQMMVRSEVLRGRFRDDPSRPTPFVPDQVTELRVPLQDVLHTFRAHHRMVIQVQSTWFPLVDRNPQTWVDNIFEAEEADFQPATHRIHHTSKQPSRIEYSVWGAGQGR